MCATSYFIFVHQMDPWKFIPSNGTSATLTASRLPLFYFTVSVCTSRLYESMSPSNMIRPSPVHLQTNYGAPVWNGTSSLTVGARGPVLLGECKQYRLGDRWKMKPRVGTQPPALAN